ncbi:MAG: pseudouridine synthase [Spirosomataceae bacterium]
MRKTISENGRKNSSRSEKPNYSSSEKKTFKPASDSKRTFGKTDSKFEPKGKFGQNARPEKSSTVGDYKKSERSTERSGFKKFDSKPGFSERKESSEWSSPKRSFRKSEDNNRNFEKKDFKPRFENSENRRLNQAEGGRFEGKREFNSNRSERKEGGRFEGKREFNNNRSERNEGGRFEGKREFNSNRSERNEGGRFEGKREFNSNRSERNEGGRFEGKREFNSNRSERKEGGRFEGKREFNSNRSERNEGGRFEKKSFKKPEYTPENKFEKEENFGKRKFNNRDSAANTQNHEWSRQVGLSIQPDYDEENLRKKLPPKVQAKIEKSERTRPETVRLNRFLANAGLCSRREADEMIASGQITVNGETITEMGYQVKTTDVVKYGRKILNREKFVYVLLNKPKDFLTTTDDPDGRKTVMDLVKNACKERIYPVGRLDRSTTGLLLLTNDGELADKLSHPSNNMKKIYQVEIDKPIVQDDFDKILEGIELEDGTIKADDLSVITPDHQVVGIEIHSGKNRIVRRIFESLGYEVTKLDRTTYAGLSKKDLPRGNWRFLTEKEVIRLKYLI